METKSFVKNLVFNTVFLSSLAAVSCGSPSAGGTDTAKPEKTAFQTGAAWRPELDVTSDVAIVYGTKTVADPSGKGEITFEQRVKSWKDRGYDVHFMTGMAWGEYQGYFNGTWDGKRHMDEGQMKLSGDTIWHGKNVPYVVPTMNFIEYIKQTQVKRAIDAGIDAIYLEEPEFWAFAGYSEAFKREWEEFYGTEWQPQNSSPQALYMSNKLKYHMFYKALDECFTFAKEYGRSKGMTVRCYVPTHSLINYSQWQIVSPEASLASLDCVDGYIAQVWTGTSRVLNHFDGRLAERVFETAYLEYGTLISMTEPTGRKVFFLTDPIEDCPRDWADFKRNYEATYVAELLYTANNNYEVMPWPERIYLGKYQTSPDSQEKEGISPAFATQMQVMVNTLNEIPLSENKVSGSHGVSVLMANSLMFQRDEEKIEGYEDPQLANYFGLAMPFVKRGVPVDMLHLENVSYDETWKNTKVLLMTYSNMKPMQVTRHTYIAKWVENGGTLVYVSRDTDPFNSVPEWWNSDGMSYTCPSDHLFSLMSIGPSPKAGTYTFGKGKVVVVRQDPKEFVMNEGGDKEFVELVSGLYEEASGSRLEIKNNFTVERGCYMAGAVMTESVSDSALVLRGRFIDLFDPSLPVVSEKTVKPGERFFLYNLDKVADTGKPAVLASAARVTDVVAAPASLTFKARGPQATGNVMRIMLPSQPVQVDAVSAEGKVKAEYAWDEASRTLQLTFPNSSDGVSVSIKW